MSNWHYVLLRIIKLYKRYTLVFKTSLDLYIFKLNMKPNKKNSTTKVPTKGVRLNWTPLHEVTPVKLTGDLTTGHVVFLPKPNGKQSSLLVI